MTGPRASAACVGVAARFVEMRSAMLPELLRIRVTGSKQRQGGKCRQARKHGACHVFFLSGCNHRVLRGRPDWLNPVEHMVGRGEE